MLRSCARALLYIICVCVCVVYLAVRNVRKPCAHQERPSYVRLIAVVWIALSLSLCTYSSFLSLSFSSSLLLLLAPRDLIIILFRFSSCFLTFFFLSKIKKFFFLNDLFAFLDIYAWSVYKRFSTTKLMIISVEP